MPNAFVRMPPLTIPMAQLRRPVVNPLPRLPLALLTPIAPRTNAPAIPLQPPVIVVQPEIPIVVVRAEPPAAPLPRRNELAVPLPRPPADPAPPERALPEAERPLPNANPLPVESAPLPSPRATTSLAAASKLLTPLPAASAVRTPQQATPATDEAVTWPALPPLPRPDLLVAVRR
jgi:hypothetical protein